VRRRLAIVLASAAGGAIVGVAARSWHIDPSGATIALLALIAGVATLWSG
jgi:hypothetical protein